MTNVAVLGGNLVRDPELRYSAAGKAFTKFTVAVNEGTGDKRTTYYIDCTCFEDTAESVAEQARKGSRVIVEGRIATDSWKDKEGRPRRTTYVLARTVGVIPRPAQASVPLAEEDLSEIPF